MLPSLPTNPLKNNITKHLTGADLHNSYRLVGKENAAMESQSEGTSGESEKREELCLEKHKRTNLAAHTTYPTPC